ncbi:universal stress protein [Hymenobacter sp. H14-R3]|uniref:universal stress protein n=1 Tax=Hymenobacter sp. H14-R3 TaxID=3046308 RepID=UPI0024B8FE8A|nr:universal stress protein [Hymenobacter sp. H14-R3]MDJ0367776.1 universal stress protein [Hymenobacter sp. H14-R3]
MTPSILVLANLPEAAAHTARYAATLGRPLGLRLALLHCYLYPTLLEPALVGEVVAQLDRNEAETLAALRALARRLPVPTEVLEATGLLDDDVATAVRRYRPLLLAMGLGPEQGLLDELLRSQVLPVLRATGRPVLLVPAATPAPGVPRRVLVAVDGEPFALAAASRNLSGLLGSWAATYTVTHVLPGPGAAARSSHLALADVQASKLLPPATPLSLYEVTDAAPVTGILQALADTQADLLVLVARPRSFWSDLFHRSVTAAVLRHTWVPVLLLPAAG